ncbi:MAG: hypothetical protein U0132_18815 [Gemmatimonadaceae bacterium]
MRELGDYLRGAGGRGSYYMKGAGLPDGSLQRVEHFTLDLLGVGTWAAPSN